MLRMRYVCQDCKAQREPSKSLECNGLHVRRSLGLFSHSWILCYHVLDLPRCHFVFKMNPPSLFDSHFRPHSFSFVFLLLITTHSLPTLRNNVPKHFPKWIPFDSLFDWVEAASDLGFKGSEWAHKTNNRSGHSKFGAGNYGNKCLDELHCCA